MKKVLITGGAGFIGSNLVDELIDGGIDVIILDDLSTGKKENINAAATFIQCDIATTTIEKLLPFFEGVDTVFHIAALARVQPSIEDPLPYNDVNITGTLRVLLSAYKAGVKRVIYSASSSAYGEATEFPTPETHSTNPLSPYGLQKLVGEQYCKMFSEVYNLDTVSLRYFNVYGERMVDEGAYCTVIGVFGKQLREGKDLTITNDGEQVRDFTYVKDVVQANILAALHPTDLKGDIFNVGTGETYSVNQIADIMGGEKTYGEKRIEPFRTLADNSKIKEVFGWAPTGNVVKWVKNYTDKILNPITIL